MVVSCVGDMVMVSPKAVPKIAKTANATIFAITLRVDKIPDRVLERLSTKLKYDETRRRSGSVDWRGR
jgi:hypothetical protein